MSNELFNFAGNVGARAYESMLENGYHQAQINNSTMEFWQQQHQYENTLKWNEEQAEKNRRYMEYYYNRYDSPDAMVRQYREAGLNPFAYSGNTGSMSSHMGTEQYANPSDAFQLGNQAVAIAGQRQQAELASRSNMLSMMQSLIGLASNIENIESQHQDVVAKRIENQKNKLGLDIFNTRIGEDDMADMPNLRAFLGNQKDYGTFGDLFYRTLYKDLAKRQYETGSGLGSNNPQSIAAAYQAFYNYHHNLDGSEQFKDSPFSLDHAQFPKGEEFAKRSFDLMLKSLVRNQADTEYNTFLADWRKMLQQRGISPDSNDIASVLQRMYLGASGTSAYDRLTKAISGNLDNVLNLFSSGFEKASTISQKIDNINKIWEKNRKKRKK